MRNAFVISDSTGGRGAGVYGAGVYATNHSNIANGYANNGDGSMFVLTFNQDANLRILNWDEVRYNPEQLALVERLASEKGYIEQESKDQFEGIFKYLDTELGVDVVQNIHTEILNLDAILIPKTMTQFLEKISAYRNQLLISASFNPKLLPGITIQCENLERMALDLGALSTDELAHAYPKLGESSDFTSYLGQFYSADAIGTIASSDLIHRENPEFINAIKTLNASALTNILTADSWESKALLWLLRDAGYFQTVDLTQDNIFGILNALYLPHLANYHDVLSTRLVEQALEKNCIEDLLSFIQKQDEKSPINSKILSDILRKCEYSPRATPEVLVLKQLACAIQASAGENKASPQPSKNNLSIRYIKLLEQYARQTKNTEVMHRNIQVLITQEDGEIDFDLLCFIWDKFHTPEYSAIDGVLCNILKTLPNIPD
ncbi:MAG: hypothetical protein K0U52_12210, partial [Gammaproteobacteria bacterium]|nr:hypothetical protein [Gammaproteobacteria bacterium]